MVNIKLLTLMFIVTLALAACNIDQTVFENEVKITDRAQDPSMSPMPGSFAENSVAVTLTSPTPDATILYTLDGTAPVNLYNFSQKVATFWEAFGQDTSCRQIYYDVYDTVYDDISGQNAGSWESELVLHVYYGTLTEAQVQSCVDTMTVFTDPQYESLDYLMNAVDPAGIDACVEVFTVMNNTIISDVNKWMDEVETQDDVVLSSCLEVFEGWNDTVGADLQAMVYTEPITITQDTTLIAVAYRNDHLPSNPIEGRFVLTGAVNQAPTVYLSSPASGASYVVGDSIVVGTVPTDSDGTISKVEFYQGTVKLGERTQSPWTYSWTPTSAGTYSLTARATDNQGLTATSSAVSVTVTEPPVENAPPSVALVNPVDGFVLQQNTSLQLAAQATDSDGTISKVEYYRGTTMIGSVTSMQGGFYSFQVNNLAIGEHTFRAKAFDNDGASKDSNTVTVRVNARPTTTVLRPVEGAEFDEGRIVYVEASAVDSDGTVSKVDFLLNGQVRSTDTTSPYATSFSNLGVGTYRLTARATDNDGASATNEVVFKVNAIVPPPTTAPPTLGFITPTLSDILSRSATALINLEARDYLGNPVRVDLFAVYTHFRSSKDHLIQIGTLTEPPYNFELPSLREGTYSFTAKATDSVGQSTDATVSITVRR